MKGSREKANGSKCEKKERRRPRPVILEQSEPQLVLGGGGGGRRADRAAEIEPVTQSGHLPSGSIVAVRRRRDRRGAHGSERCEGGPLVSSRLGFLRDRLEALEPSVGGGTKRTPRFGGGARSENRLERVPTRDRRIRLEHRAAPLCNADGPRSDEHGERDDRESSQPPSHWKSRRRKITAASASPSKL